jgi:hypothetical protein
MFARSAIYPLFPYKYLLFPAHSDTDTDTNFI